MRARLGGSTDDVCGGFGGVDGMKLTDESQVLCRRDKTGVTLADLPLEFFRYGGRRRERVEKVGGPAQFSRINASRHNRHVQDGMWMGQRCHPPACSRTISLPRRAEQSRLARSSLVAGQRPRPRAWRQRQQIKYAAVQGDFAVGENRDLVGAIWACVGRTRPGEGWRAWSDRSQSEEAAMSCRSGRDRARTG
nr:hypothetical protein CFP56_36308 [Quercus suber]